MRRYFRELFRAEVDEFFAFQTLQWKNSELYLIRFLESDKFEESNLQRIQTILPELK